MLKIKIKLNNASEFADSNKVPSMELMHSCEKTCRDVCFFPQFFYFSTLKTCFNEEICKLHKITVFISDGIIAHYIGF